MKKLVSFFIINYKLTIIFSLFFVIMGALGLKKMNAESYPAVDFAMAIIETRYPGASAEDVETKITKKIEDEIRQVSGLKDVRSVSQSGFSKIFIRADMDNVDVTKVMSDLEKKLDRVSDLPPDLPNDPKFTEINSEEFPAIELAIVGDNTNRMRDLIADQLKEELEDIDEVLNVRPTGYTKREFRIKLNQSQMDKHHIGVDEILLQIAKRNVNIPGGDFEQEDTQLLVRIEGKITDASDLGRTVLRSNFTGQQIQLKDVAEVIDAAEDAVVLASYNGKPATLLIVSKKAGTDTISLVKKVTSIVEQYQQNYSDKVSIHVYNNEAIKVKDKLDILSSNALTGMVLVVVFLLVFLPGITGIVASLSLPLAVFATFGLMPSFGLNLNAITILALVIALGMLVDNSVVISENFTRLKEEGLKPQDAAINSVMQLWLPITCTGLTTIAAFLPMLVTKGIMGEFIKNIPIVVSLALLLSLVESFFLLPMRLTMTKSRIKKVKENSLSWFDQVSSRFEAAMDVLIKRRYIVLIGFGALIFGALALMVFGNKFILFPAEQTEIYVARFEMPKGTTLNSTMNKALEISQAIKQAIPDYLRETVARAGTSQVQPTDPRGKEGDFIGMVVIYANEFAKYNVAYTDVLKKLRKIQVEGVALLSFEELVNGPPVGAAINATFRSNDQNQLNQALKVVIDQLSKIEGIMDLEIDDVIGEDEVFVEVDFKHASRLGINVLQVGEVIRTALSGSTVSNVTLLNKEVDLKVEMDNISFKDIDSLKSLKVMDSRSNLIPIGDFSNFKRTDGTPIIKRYNYKRAKTLTGNVKEELITSQKANQILRKVFNQVRSQFPEVSRVFGGQEESTKESLDSLADALVLALIGIFALLVFLFKSFLRPLLIMTTIPLGLIGFSVAFYFHNRPISFLAMIGIIGLAGIIVNSGIVLISFIDEMKNESEMTLHQALVKASTIRLRAVMVTSLTTISGLLPTAYGIGGQDAMLVPMTMAMAWGLTSGTILTLIWIPCAYAILEDYLAWFYQISWVKKITG